MPKMLFCRFRTDSARITCGLAVGRSLDHMIYVEAFRRCGRVISDAVYEQLVVTSPPCDQVGLVKLVGHTAGVYRGVVLCRRHGAMYACRVRPGCRDFSKKPMSPVAPDDGAQVVLTADYDHAALPRDLEI